MRRLNAIRERNERLRHRIIIIAGLITVLILALLTLAAWRARQDALEAARLQTSYLASAFREDLEGMLNSLAIAAEIAKRRIEIGSELSFLAELREDVSKYIPSVVNVSVISSDGTLRATSGDIEALPKDFSSFSFFLDSRNSRSLGNRIGLPVAGILQVGPVIPVGQRLETREGQFSGVLVLLLDPERGSAMYRRVELGQSGSIQLIGKNGQLYAGYTLPRGFDQAEVGSSAVSEETLAMLRSSPSGTFEAKGFRDGIERIYAWRTITGTGDIALAGLGRTEALASARRQALRLLTLAFLTIGFFAWLTFMLVQEIARRTKHALLLDRQRAVLRRKNAQLTAAKQNAEEISQSKTLFLANMGHELRTSLNSILGFAEVIRSRAFGNDLDRYSGYAADIYESGTHILNVVRNLLDFTKIESGKFELHEEWLDAGELGSECLHLMRGQAENRGVKLSELPECHSISLYADATVLRQILFNLLSNGIKFTPKGGTVALVIEPEANGGLALSARDSGVGMTASEIERALKPFHQVGEFSARAEGTGLGLPLVSQLVHLHGGSLTIDSKPGAGTTVTVSFPASRVRIGAAPHGEEREPENPAQRSVS